MELIKLIKPLKVLKDNYVWFIHSFNNNNEVIVVDPGEAEPVIQFIIQHDLKLKALLLTHRHPDHTAGVIPIVKRFPDTPVYSSKTDQVPGVTEFVEEGRAILFKSMSLTVNVMDIPGHTLGHVAYLIESALFCGDTLFSCGAGKIFEGTPAQMFHSLNKLKQLPKNTLVCAGHEYTLANIAFARFVDPNNEDLIIRLATASELNKKGVPTLPVTLEEELKTNPFLRCDAPEIVSAVEKHGGQSLANSVAVFAYLREWKNRF